MSRFSIFRRKKDSREADLPEVRESQYAQTAPGRVRKDKNDDESDPILPEKKRARRRLVGAIAITLTAFIVLPMLFDSEPPTDAQNLLIDIPSRDSTPVAAAGEKANKPEQKTPSAAPKSTEKSSEAPGKSSEAPAASDAKKAGTPPPAAKETQAAAKPQTAAKPQAEKADDDPIGQLIEKTTSTKENEKQNRFVVQVAAVSAADKAKELQDRLKKAGLTSYTQKVTLNDGSERIRVRIGPMASKKELDNTCARLSQLKLPCTLVN